MSSGRVRFFVMEALRSLRNNFATTLAATVTVFIVMCVFGVGAALGSYIFNYTEKVKGDVTVKVWLATNVTDAQKTEINAKLHANPLIRTVNFVSKEQALEDQRRKNPQITSLLVANPYTDAFFVKARNASDAPRIAASVRGLPGLDPPKDGEDNPDYGAKLSDKVLSTASVIETVIVAIALVLGVAAVLLIGNTIRLSIYARRREVEVMKLVGATNWFVRWPFMLEGMLCGAVGALAAVVVLLLGYWRLKGWLVGSTLGERTVGAMSFPVLAGLLFLAGIGLGAAGSGITMRRFLRV